ncbi:MAG: ribonuclease H family protein [Bacteroidales bacterium]|jgi:ribonuclease HI|nr:ribonuclease H family protein [Bacteroidales bacterium]
MKQKSKFYVVWQGHQSGIFKSWADCERQIKGFTNAKYKSFPTLSQAQQAFEEGAEAHLGKKESPMQPIFDTLYGKPIIPSIAVDGAFSSSTKKAEYQGVNTQTGVVIFRCGPFMEGTNNVMEFLAIVHALALCKQHCWNKLPIYSDSVNAMLWIKAKKARTNLVPTSQNKVIFDLIQRAEKWLKTTPYNNPILKWETKAWGEIPADFGRK